MSEPLTPDEAQALALQAEHEARRIDEALIVVTRERDQLRGQLAEVREGLPALLDDLEAATAALAVHDAHKADLQRFRHNPAAEEAAAKARAAVLALGAPAP